jgi:hypothetical protein
MTWFFGHKLAEFETSFALWLRVGGIWDALGCSKVKIRNAEGEIFRPAPYDQIL